MNYFYTCLLCALSFFANAQTVCSTIASGDWTNNAIWSCGTAPTGTFSGTIIIQNNVSITSNVTISGLATVVITNNSTLNVAGNNALTLSNNASKVTLNTGSTVSGQNANSVIIVGTSPTTTYKSNGSGNAISGPIVLTNSGQALPVTLVLFSASPQGKRVSIAWATASEDGASQFSIERSHNVGEFVTIGIVQATGTTSIRQNYGLIDEQPLPGINYYRLRQVDFDGTTTYSKTVSVQVNEFEPGLLVLGNPVRIGTIYLSTQNLANATYQLMSLSGQMVETKTAAQTNGDVAVTLVNRPAPGLYLLTAQTGSARLVRKILID
ncbi:T9SS type A sorting domain-containing protein [uncultured Fibrella sp.]|uniref:T9SS type A sorting domain-containing protein n=1 Tax=uncultured Fibrella sp. TaxID=1284596 RepID=UPI0035CB2AF5